MRPPKARPRPKLMAKAIAQARTLATTHHPALVTRPRSTSSHWRMLGGSATAAPRPSPSTSCCAPGNWTAAWGRRVPMGKTSANPRDVARLHMAARANRCRSASHWPMPKGAPKAAPTRKGKIGEVCSRPRASSREPSPTQRRTPKPAPKAEPIIHASRKLRRSN